MIGHKPLLGGVELGGTKCVCIIGTGPGDIRAQTSIPTGSDPAVPTAASGPSWTMDGGNGNDQLVGSAGDDSLVGGAGNDTYIFDFLGTIATLAVADGFLQPGTTLSGDIELTVTARN